MQKKLIFLALTGLLCLSLAGCGQSGSTSPEGGSSPQAEQPAEETAGEDGGRTPEEDGADTEAPQYTDNFSIDTEAVTAFAEQIQAAVAEKDLEALADHWKRTGSSQKSWSLRSPGRTPGGWPPARQDLPCPPAAGPMWCSVLSMADWPLWE